MPLVKVYFPAEHLPLLYEAVGFEKVSSYCHRVVMAEISRRHPDARSGAVARRQGPMTKHPSTASKPRPGDGISHSTHSEAHS